MTPTPLHLVLRQLRQRLAVPESPAPSDGQLLRRFARQHAHDLIDLSGHGAVQ